nr:hypothetical protein [uncultured Albidiferax sp.]
MIASTSSGIAVSGLVVFIVSAMVASSLPFWWPLVVGLCCAVALNLWAWRRVTLWPIPKESVRTASKVDWFLTALSAVLMIFS